MRVIIDFWVFLSTLTGLIPSHTVRLFLYRHLFRVKIGRETHLHWLGRFNQPSGVEIGNNCVIGNDFFLDGRQKRDWGVEEKKGKRGDKNDEETAVGRKWEIYCRDFFSGRNYRPLKIGGNVSIAGWVRIFTMEHDINDPDFTEKGEAVVIEDDVVIGSNALILPGVTVGRGAVVAAGAVVTRKVEPYTVVAGVPAREIGNRSRDLRYKLNFGRIFQ